MTLTPVVEFDLHAPFESSLLSTIAKNQKSREAGSVKKKRQREDCSLNAHHHQKNTTLWIKERGTGKKEDKKR
jgi:hypothetical protein